MNNFTTLDILGATQAAVGFAAILLAPGYLLGVACNLFGFRERSLLERLAWAVALSYAISPILIQLAGRILPLSGVAILFAASAAAMLVLLVLDCRRLRIPIDRSGVLLALFLFFGATVIMGELVDIQCGHRLYLSVTILDQAFRVAFTNAIAHTGIPPQNPLYHPGAAAPLRYYYFWYAVCAVCMKLAHVSARQALIASSVWAGIGLVALMALFARHFLGVRERLNRFILVAALLLTVTGLDILPALHELFVSHDFGGDLEWWSTDQIASWLDTILWVPNHTAALLCCLMALLLLWRTREQLARKQAVIATILAGVAAASAFGLSVYVAAGFAMLMVGWAASLFFRERNVALVRRMAMAVATAAILLLPYLRDLAGSRSGTQERAAAGPSHLFQLSVRKMIDSELITRLDVFAKLNHAHPVLLDQAVRLVLLLPGYALELGVYALVLVLALLDRKRLNLPDRTALALILGGFFLVSFLRSSVIGNNDFGYRAALLPCFLLLLLTAEKLTSIRTSMQSQLLSLLIFAGVAGTALQALMLRSYVPLHVAAHMQGFEGLPEAAFDARTAYTAAAARIPPSAIVQANPVATARYFSMVNMLYSERAMVTDAEVDCGAVFGGDPASCLQTQKTVRSLFLAPSPSASEAVARCRELGADYLSASPRDPAWQDKSGWVWTLPLAVTRSRPQADRDTENFRILDCTGSAASMPKGL